MSPLIVILFKLFSSRSDNNQAKVVIFYLDIYKWLYVFRDIFKMTLNSCGLRVPSINIFRTLDQPHRRYSYIFEAWNFFTVYSDHCVAKLPSDGSLSDLISVLSTLTLY